MKLFHHIMGSLVRTVALVAALAGVLAPSAHALVTRDSTIARAASMSGSLADMYPFTLSVTGAIDYFTSGIDSPPPFSITSFVATLFTGSSPVSRIERSPAGVLMPNSFFVGSLAPGDQLRISGLPSGTPGVDGYNRALRVTAPDAPVPDPEIWTMLLLGVGLVGMRLRRKSRLDSARHFA